MEELGKERDAYSLGGVSPDPNSSWVISISRIRELKREMMYPPRILPYRVAILFDFDRVREEGANAFLKTLEEPQSQSVLILTTSRPFALPATIRSRSKLVRFNALDDEVVSEKLLGEGFPREKVAVATDVAFGSLKQAYRFIEDPSSVIMEEVFEYLKDPSHSALSAIGFAEQLSYRVELTRVISSFALVFRWLVRARSGKRPSWSRLASLVDFLSTRISREALVSNILLTEKMGARIILNPTPSLFLYRYLSSLRFD